MGKYTYKIEGSVFVWSGEMASWRFVSVDKKTSREIKEKFGKGRRGFGSIPVIVTIGETEWKTSIFPDSKTETYILPLKSQVRRKEGILDEDIISFEIGIDKERLK